MVGENTLEKQIKHALTRSMKHQEDSVISKKERFSTTEYSKDCHGRLLIGCSQKHLRSYPINTSAK